MALKKLKTGVAFSSQVPEQNTNLEQIDKFMTGGGNGKFSIGEPERADRQGLSLGGAFANRRIHFEDPNQRIIIRYATGYTVENSSITNGIIIGPVGGAGFLFLANQIWTCDVDTGTRYQRVV